jgi:transglutaminase-like putative cysteine protease
MKLSQLAILLFVTTCFSSLKAQEFELGKVSVAELQEKTHPKDTAAVAAILFKKGKTSYDYSKNNGFVMTTEVQTRIKIYKKEGYDWANQKVKYYLGNGSKENVTFSDAITYNLVEGKIEKTKLSKDGEFDDEVNRYWGQKKISMPNVNEGSVIEFEYTIKTPYVGSPKDWTFQASIPVNYSEYRSFIPEYYTLNTNFKGFVFPKVTVEKKVKSVLFSTMEREDGAGLMRAQTSNYAQSKLSYEETRTTYIAENLPGMIEEAYVNNIENYTAGLVQEVSMIKYPNQALKYLSTDWNAVVKTIYDYDDFGLELAKTAYFEDDIDVVIAGLNSEEEKVAAIFTYAKTSVKWNNYYGYSCNDGVKTAYKNKTGNVAEINLMLTAMLRYAGLAANPVLVSTRSNGIALFPNITAFNYVIVGIERSNGLQLLDATEILSVPNVLPLRDLNWLGRLVRKDGTSVEVNLTPATLSREMVIMNVVVNDNGTILGKFKRQLTNHEALLFRQKNGGTAKDTYLEELEHQNNDILIDDYERENDLEVLKPIVESYKFKSTKDFERVNDKIYISPGLFLGAKGNPFKQEIREYPIDFGYPNQKRYNISIEIPKGYAVETIPDGLNIAAVDGIGSFKYDIAKIGNQLQISMTTEISKAIVLADYYQALKAFFQIMLDKQNEKIILTKV